MLMEVANPDKRWKTPVCSPTFRRDGKVHSAAFGRNGAGERATRDCRLKAVLRAGSPWAGFATAESDLGDLRTESPWAGFATVEADLADDGGSSARTNGDVFGFIFLAGPVWPLARASTHPTIYRRSALRP